MSNPFDQVVQISFPGQHSGKSGAPTPQNSSQSLSMEARLLLCQDLITKKNFQAAETELGRILQENQESSDVFRLLAMIRKEQGKSSEQYASLVRQLELDPDNYEAKYNAAQVLVHMNQMDKAKKYALEVCEIQPKNPYALHMVGIIQYFQKDFEDCVQTYAKALEIKPDFPGGWSNKGAAHQSLAQYHEAKYCYEQSFKYSSSIRDPINNYGNVMQCLGDFDVAKEYYQKALDFDPTYVEPAYSLAEMQLQVGEFTKGWEGYRLRCQKREHDRRQFVHPDWNGEPMPNEKLLVFAEQGIGDLVMFASCLPDLLQICPHVTLEIDHRMVGLFQNSFPQIEVMPRSMKSMDGVKMTIPGIDKQISIAELGRIFRNSYSDFPRTAFLQADPQKREIWRHRFAALGKGLKVGISWKGGKDKDTGTRRSANIENWKGIFQIPDIHLVNLQYGDCSEEKAWIEKNCQTQLHDWSDCDPKKDLETFSAQIQELDLVLSIDNATVHFAGGLGATTWILLPKLPDWRWGLNTNESYWYPELRLFRQTNQFEWAPVFHEVEQRLRHLAKNQVSKTYSIKTLTTGEQKKLETPVAKPLKCAILSIATQNDAIEVDENLKMIQETVAEHQGPFESFVPLRIMVPQGLHTLARALNLAVHQAKEYGCEWILVLPPKTRIIPNLFDFVQPHLEHVDALWGLTYYYEQDINDAQLLKNQMPATDSFHTFLRSDPATCVGPSFLLRSQAGTEIDWRESLGAASEYEGLMRLWRDYRCVKLNQPLSADYAPEGKLRNAAWIQGAYSVLANYTSSQSAAS
jgi:tetratricopeptide (TPR) repeat protein